jgi:hypothetical protein
MAEDRDYIEATVQLADWQLEPFLSFCEEELDQLPELSRIPPEELHGYRELFELLAAEEDGRLQPDLSGPSMN